MTANKDKAKGDELQQKIEAANRVAIARASDYPPDPERIYFKIPEWEAFWGWTYKYWLYHGGTIPTFKYYKSHWELYDEKALFYFWNREADAFCKQDFRAAHTDPIDGKSYLVWTTGYILDTTHRADFFVPQYLTDISPNLVPHLFAKTEPIALEIYQDAIDTKAASKAIVNTLPVENTGQEDKFIYKEKMIEGKLIQTKFRGI